MIWDQKGRGKNNGSLSDATGLHVYFSCDPLCGSFVQPAKLRKCYSIQEVFQTKWDCARKSNCRYKKEGKESYQASERMDKYELVGMDAIAELQRSRCIRTADLTNQMICELGDCDSHLLLLENLNISSNQIHQWSQLVRIIDSLPRLRLLLMNDNLLQPGPERLSYSSPLEVWFGIAYDADSGLVKNFASLQRSSAAISLASPSLDASVGLQRDERASRGRLSRLAPLARPDGELFLRVVGAGGCERVSECHLAVSGRESDWRRG